MKKSKIISIALFVITPLVLLGQKPTSISLQDVKVVLPNDTLVFADKIDEPIAPFDEETAIELVKNDSIKIELVINYKVKRSGKKIRKTKHNFYYRNKKLRRPSRWKTDLPFFAKLTGFGWKWESVSVGGSTVSSTTFGSYARLPRGQGEMRLICEETLFFK